MASIEFCLTDKQTSNDSEWWSLTLAGTDRKLSQCFFPEIQSHECCVSVNEDNNCVLDLLNAQNNYRCFHFRMNTPADLIDYTGISIIPPETLTRLSADWKDHVPNELISLFNRAVSEDKLIVMLGL